MDTTKQTKLSKISNILFIIITSYLLSFVIISYFFKEIKIILTLSISLELIFISIFLPIYFHKSKSKKLIEIKNINIKNTKNKLMFNKNIENIKLFEKILNLKDYKKISDNHLFCKKDYFFIFNIETLSESKFYSILGERITDNIEIYCIDSQNINIKIKNIDIKIINLEEIIKLIEENNLKLDYNYCIEKTSKYSIKQLLSIALCKNKSRHYFLLGILMLFLSIFTPFYNYYVIISTLLIILSIFTRFNKIFN